MRTQCATCSFLATALMAVVMSAEAITPTPRPTATPSAIPRPTTTVVPTVTVDRNHLRFGAVNDAGALTQVTPPQTIMVTTPGCWTASSNQSYVTVTPSIGYGPGVLTVRIGNVGPPAPGSAQATVTVTAPAASGSPQTITVDLQVYAPGTTAAPFGWFDTPIHNSTGVTGAIGVTGWALDDIGIDTVELWRDPVNGDPAPAANGKIYIGNATFVAGARSDVEALYAAYPRSYYAAWGYMLLTNLLPNVATGAPAGGVGTFTLYAYVYDFDRHLTILPPHTFTCDNTAATKPFGTIDTPGQGETVSGTVNNFGWVLTPPGGFMPTDGSTIRLFIDSLPRNTALYNLPRSDVTTLFPGYANTSGPVGFFSIDTTALANGVHTIAWSAADNLGRADGIGSRYFTVQNVAAGASFNGPFPTPQTVNYTRGGQPVSVTAFPGEVILFLSPIPCPSDARALVESKGGTVLSQLPDAGYYLVGVAPGSEGAFITAVSTDSRVFVAQPNTASALDAAGATILDGCTVGHSAKTAQALTNNGGTMLPALLEGCRNIVNVDINGVPIGGQTTVNAHLIATNFIQVASGAAGGAPVFINMSASGGSLHDWRVILAAIAQLPPSQRANLVLTLSAGNANVNFAATLATLRTEPRLADVLTRNVLIVGTQLTTNNCPGLPNGVSFSNCPGPATGLCTSRDPAFGIMNNPEAACGTSFAAPAALAVIQQVMDQAGVSAAAALAAAKSAIAANAGGQLVLAEAVARAIAAARPTPTPTSTPTPTPRPTPTSPPTPTGSSTATPTAATPAPTPTATPTATPDPNCCDCNFDVYCTVYGPGGCWYCRNVPKQNGACPAPPYGHLVSPGTCTCDPDFYEVCQ